MEHSTVDLCIVGAGAAGLAAGIFAGEGAAAAGTGLPLQIALLDGAKLEDAVLVAATVLGARGLELATCDQATAMPGGWVCSEGHPSAAWRESAEVSEPE